MVVAGFFALIFGPIQELKSLEETFPADCFKGGLFFRRLPMSEDAFIIRSSKLRNCFEDFGGSS